MLLNILLILFALVLGILCIAGTWLVLSTLILKVPFVPTSNSITEIMIDLAEIHPGMVVYDLGCGNGKLLFAAEKHGAKCIGYEQAGAVFWWARLLQKFKKSSVQFRQEDLFTADIEQADIVFCYLFPSHMARVGNELWPRMKPNAKLISHAFEMPGGHLLTEKTVGKVRVLVYEKKLKS